MPWSFLVAICQTYEYAYCGSPVSNMRRGNRAALPQLRAIVVRHKIQQRTHVARQSPGFVGSLEPGYQR